jgi:class 3 adenylate cyclase
MDRRLAAILAVDMAGYSRLMEKDEESVLKRQKGHRRELIDPEIGSHGGRIVKTTGDGMLVEFASAQDAVRCAINIQTAMVERERATVTDSRIVYRVGINLGDIIFDEGDVFGDGVNVASRLQTRYRKIRSWTR